MMINTPIITTATKTKTKLNTKGFYECSFKILVFRG